MIVGTPGFHYAQNAAPFREIDIVLPHETETMKWLPTAAAQAAGGILMESWTTSDWLRQEIGVDAYAQTRRNGVAALRGQGVYVANMAYVTEEQVLAFAVRPLLAAVDPAGRRLENVLPAQYVGFANGKVDVSGNFFQRVLKRHFRQEHVYSCVSNGNVRPAFQGHGLGIALFDAVLSGLPQERFATTYTARSNTRLIDSLGRIGFVPTGSRPRDDLVAAGVIDEVRLQGPPAGEVRENLAAIVHWLKNAEIIS